MNTRRQVIVAAVAAVVVTALFFFVLLKPKLNEISNARSCLIPGLCKPTISSACCFVASAEPPIQIVNLRSHASLRQSGVRRPT